MGAIARMDFLLDVRPDALSNTHTCEQAATTYAQLLNTQSDNNVKLIVLERLAGLKKHHAKVLQEVLMDILRALSSPNVDICRKTLEVAMDLVTPRNIEEVVQVRSPPPL